MIELLKLFAMTDKNNNKNKITIFILKAFRLTSSSVKKIERVLDTNLYVVLYVQKTNFPWGNKVLI